MPERLDMIVSSTYLNARMKLKDELGERSYRNWIKLPDLIRRECLHELKSAVPANAFSRWLNEYRTRGTVEEDNPLFHFDMGMTVRNVLRRHLADSELSSIDGNECRDWDGLYVGALRELLDTAR